LFPVPCCCNWLTAATSSPRCRCDSKQPGARQQLLYRGR
jgi:hypothetical protein